MTRSERCCEPTVSNRELSKLHSSSNPAQSLRLLDFRTRNVVVPMALTTTTALLTGMISKGKNTRLVS
ncbi:hypothetical protein NEOLEDRAFT_1135720 [Neolentinus lepideus HHB14362 ss-1]|uniref:Uncharacterized protein n=1 Tax=Neolentinus lepideus HHB14362 ss-1 TaxID=1314782 RepID=A0A165RJ69_9AGAM|nr:hypothetical protein NEOLEDRAFT_1135720 [Neolentinus lepideus HHB14362 ss-1]